MSDFVKPRTSLRIAQGNQIFWRNGDKPHAELDARVSATQMSSATKEPVAIYRHSGSEVKLIARYVDGKPA